MKTRRLLFGISILILLIVVLAAVFPFRSARNSKRPGAGRRRIPEPLEWNAMTLYKTHAKFPRKIEGNVSRTYAS